MQNPDFNISDEVQKFEEVVMAKIIPAFDFEFMPKDEVVNNEHYQELHEMSMYRNAQFQVAPAEGYTALAAFGIIEDNDAIKKSFEIYPGVDAVMIAYIDFNLVDAGGIGPYMAKTIKANCNVKLYNKDAKRIFKLKASGKESKTKCNSVGGIVTDVNKINTMIQEASDELWAEIDKKIDKTMAKMVKKLEKKMSK